MSRKFSLKYTVDREFPGGPHRTRHFRCGGNEDPTSSSNKNKNRLYRAERAPGSRLGRREKRQQGQAVTRRWGQGRGDGGKRGDNDRKDGGVGTDFTERAKHCAKQKAEVTGRG